MILTSVIVILILGLFLVTNSTENIKKNLQKNKEIDDESKRKGRAETPVCATQTGARGLCMRRLECMRNGGSASGFCGTFGVCCEMNLQCGKISNLKRTVIQSPSYLPRHCAYHFQPYSSNVCQLRLDFDIVLAQPTLPNATLNDMHGITCSLDKFEVGDIRLCGTNIKQHIYLPFDAVNGITDLALTFTLADRAQNPSLPGYWRMIVAQLECPTTSSSERQSGFSFLGINQQDLRQFFRPAIEDLDTLAPPGCLQYFVDRHGHIESFNFNKGAGPYMANMRYGICFKRTSFDKGVQFTSDVFEIGAESETNSFIENDCHDPLGSPARSNDYLAISESLLVSTPTMLYGNYYCGTSLKGSDLFHAPPGPFAIYFNSDGLLSSITQEVGFKINYVIMQ